MEKEEKKWIIVGLVVAVALAVIFGIPTWMQLYDIPPPDIMSALLLIAIISGFTVCIFAIVKTVLHYKPSVEWRIKKDYHKRLRGEIRSELEKKIVLKNIVLQNQEKADVISNLTEAVFRDILNGRLLPKYTAREYPDKPDSMKIANNVFMISQENAVILAAKMTELYNNQKYRRRLYRYSSLFI